MPYPQPPLEAAQAVMLEAFLDYHGALMVDRATGPDRDQLNQTLDPPTITLGNLVHHLAFAEQYRFHEIFSGGDPMESWAERVTGQDWEFTVAAGLDSDVLLARYAEACCRSRRIVREADSLDQLAVRESWGRVCSLRWVLVHMIEETARHVGHADLIRESVDGAVGDFLHV